MGDPSFIGGDWGTSHLRLFLCDGAGTPTHTKPGPGAAEVDGNFHEIFLSLTSAWRKQHGTLPAVLCGMVGSNIGWTQAPYVACPTKLDSIADACVSLGDGSVHIVPGLSCRNRLHAPDFLRGEETQILGALSLVDMLNEGRQLLCLPGTHTKWVELQDGTIREFLTAPTGEVFAVLNAHSVLVRDSRSAEPADTDAFKQGLEEFARFSDAQLLHRLFECRARQLSGALTAHAASGYLSGLCIASDVHGARRLFSHAAVRPQICVIGSSELSRLYTAALSHQDCDVQTVDGAAASLAGLAQIHRRLSNLGARA